LVLLKEDAPRMMWRKGCVTKLITGSDGIVRGAEISTEIVTDRVPKNPHDNAK